MKRWEEGELADLEKKKRCSEKWEEMKGKGELTDVCKEGRRSNRGEIRKHF
jgi:hypothetical protein